MAGNSIVNMFKIKELRSRLLFTLLILAVFRMGSVLTIPGIDANVLLSYFDELARQNKNAFASYMDFFVTSPSPRILIFALRFDGMSPFATREARSTVSPSANFASRSETLK